MKAARVLHRFIWLSLLALAGVPLVAFFRSPAGAEFVLQAVQAYVWCGVQFRVVNASTPLFRVLLPAVISSAAVYAVMLLHPRPSRIVRVGVILFLVALYTLYMAFRLFATLNLGGLANAIFSILFLLAEALIYLKSLSANFQMLWPSNRTPEATELSQWVTSGRYLPTVDIFVPTYSEPVEILRRTILACQSLRYPRKQIYLLDDQRRPQMRALARELGCHYRDRPDNRDAKAGNMNAALPTSQGELIAVFDADFVPTEDFLERTVGFFRDPIVGLVQTPQNFYSVDAVSRNLGLPSVITEEQQVFFRAAQPGRDTFGAMICHGTSFVIRRSALAEIGNFPGETLSEDWATSIKLQAQGYRCCYLNELLSAGAAAEFTSEFVTQRLRWARGTLQCFHASTNPLTIPGLNLLQRLSHLCGPLHYLPFVSRFFCILLPLFYFFFGIVPLRTSGEQLLVFFLPFCACQILSLSWLTGGHRSAFWSEVYETMLCWPMTLTVFAVLFKPFGKPFKVSAKGGTQSRLAMNWFVGLPLLIILLLYIPTIIHAIATADWYPEKSVFVIAVSWSAYSMLLLWLSFQAGFDVPQHTSALRFKQELAASLRQRGIAMPAVTLEVSEVDVLVEATEEMPLHSGLTLSIPSCGLQDAPVSVAEQLSPCRTRFKFDNLTVPQQRALIAALYCRPGQWDERGVPEQLTFWHFLEAPFRMYPLAETR